MKTLNRFITEKLKLSKDTKIVITEERLADILIKNCDKESNDHSKQHDPDYLESILVIQFMNRNNIHLPTTRYTIDWKYLTDNYCNTIDMLKVLDILDQKLEHPSNQNDIQLKLWWSSPDGGYIYDESIAIRNNDKNIKFWRPLESKNKKFIEAIKDKL